MIRDTLKYVIAETTGLDREHPDVTSAAERVFDHLKAEITIIGELERQRRLKPTPASELVQVSTRLPI